MRVASEYLVDIGALADGRILSEAGAEGKRDAGATSDGRLFDEIDDANDIDDPRTEGRRKKVPSEARKRPSPPGRARPGERERQNLLALEPEKRRIPPRFRE